MKREIVHIDNEKCNGCGLCIPNCHEGALQIIDGKAVLVSDLMCDGLGACLGHCPEGALTIETREAVPYDEIEVMKEMVSKGKNVVIAHLQHLEDHNEKIFLQQGIDFLKENRNTLNFNPDEVFSTLKSMNTKQTFTPAPHHAELTQGPIQLHLINPQASYFTKSDLLVAADCTAFSLGGFHGEFLKGKKVVIACPKLDSNKESYIQKFVALIEQAQVNTITVAIMEVPCCGGLLQMVQLASQQAKRKVPIKAVTIGIQGGIVGEEWI
jgi:NAD-dependent dihydropyrimidine dehydrogenase PreA subunit